MSSPNEAFIKCRIEISYLENWLGDSPFKFDIADSCEHVCIDYTRPKNEEYPIDACKCLVRFVRAVKLPGLPSHAPSIEHRAVIEIDSSDPMPLGWFQTRLSELVDLFSFLYGGNIQSRQLALFKSTTDDTEAALYYPWPNVAAIEYGAMDKAGVPESTLQHLIHSHVRSTQERTVWCKITEEGSLFNGAENGNIAK